MIDIRSLRSLARAVVDELAHHLQGAAPVHEDTPVPSCVIGDRPHPRQDGMLICEWHRQELSRILRHIEDEAVHLSVVPSLAVRYDSGSGSSAPAFERAPLRLEARSLIDWRRGTGVTRHDRELDETGWDETMSVLETLHWWARLVREERKILPPTVTVVLDRGPRDPRASGPVCDRLCGHDSCGPWITDTVLAPATVTGERALLTLQLDWITRQPWVDEMHTQLTELLAQLHRANNSLEVHVGTCGTLRPDGNLCDGKVWHVLVKPDGRVVQGDRASGPDDEPGFRCSSCRRVWTGTEAVRKRDDLWRDEQARKVKA